MKKKRVQELPLCDFKNLPSVVDMCSVYAKYDAPTKRGTWANMCEVHYKIHAAKGADALGCELVKGLAEPAPPHSKFVHGVEPNLAENQEYWENVLLEGIREITCPECGEERRMEPDATGIFNCDGCGVRVKCPAPPI
jgi:hypothetical protein